MTEESSRDGTVLELRDVYVRRSQTTILDGISWRVAEGEHWAVVGPNGSGKTTMLKVATGSMWPSRGRVSALGHRYGKVDLRALRRRIGWVSSALEEWIQPREKARDVVLSGLYASFGIYEEPDIGAVRRASELLEFFGCGALVERPYRVLSQGEKQRVLIARSLMTQAELLILDEAAAGLDISAREVLLEAVEKLAAQPDGPALIFVTHHIEEIVPAITHVLVLKEGRVVAAGEKGETLTGGALSEAFRLSIELDRSHGRYWPRVRNFGTEGAAR
ncbi:MAG: ABC transporter ATP-binding protein [Planctomycetota bacterium]